MSVCLYERVTERGYGWIDKQRYTHRHIVIVYGWVDEWVFVYVRNICEYVRIYVCKHTLTQTNIVCIIAALTITGWSAMIKVAVLFT